MSRLIRRYPRRFYGWFRGGRSVLRDANGVVQPEAGNARSKEPPTTARGWRWHFVRLRRNQPIKRSGSYRYRYV